jgi:tRNA(Ile)-lysidine synthase
MLIQKVKNTIQRYGLINSKGPLLIGVSGGADSVCLLHILSRLKKELGIKIFVAHLDHMLRKDSRKDAEFVARLCAKLKVPLVSGRVDVNKAVKNASLEEVARNARLNFLFKAAKKLKTKTIALGHNLDDQAETVLMRILRGSGLYGLSAILPKRTISGYRIIRPLIEVKRKEIEGYLRKRKIKYHTDISNTQSIYFRNKIRNQLLPLLEKKYSPNIKELLANMAENIGHDYDYMNHSVMGLCPRFKTKFSLTKLSNMHPALQRMLFRNAISALKGDTRRITFRHMREIEDLILNRPVNSIVDLPKGISVVKKKSCLEFLLKKQQ